MKPRKILFFVNPISGSAGKKNELKKKISNFIIAKNIPFEILDTKEDGNYDFLHDKIRLEKFTDVVICGGDGTINKIAAALINLKVNIGIIPGGSGNGLAFSVKIPAKTEEALAVLFSAEAYPIDAFYINESFSCMLCGIGLDAQIAHDFSRQNSRGLATYVKESFKNFIDTGTYNFTITINNNDINTDAFFISIANSNQFGNNFTIAPKAKVHDGLLDIIVVQKMNKAKLVWAILKQLKFGKIMQISDSEENIKDILYFQTTSLKITNHNKAPLHIDGDPSETAEEFNIKILPKSLNLIHP